jgi:uncharacterized protein YjbJ (UPF0337 family)
MSPCRPETRGFRPADEPHRKISTHFLLIALCGNVWIPRPLEVHVDSGGMTMDWNRVEGNWKQVKGKAKEKWGKLTDDDLNVIEGRRDQLEGKLQQRYGFAKDQIHKDVDDWFKSLK